LKSALTDGVQVSGASLAYPNEMSLVLKARISKEAA
jgi:hypothetical protein